MLLSLLLKFKANYLEKMRDYPNCSLWTPIAVAKILLSPRGSKLAQKPLYFKGTVLKTSTWNSFSSIISEMFYGMSQESIAKFDFLPCA